MTEKELREKIIKALKHGGDLFHEYFMRSLNDAKEIGKTHFGSKDCDKSMYDFFADALIADGIGDVSEYGRLKTELRSKVDYIHELWDVKEDYKHRAEVAEKALKLAGDKYVNEVCNIMAKENNPCDYDCYDCFYNYFTNQAEKELQEERKDEQD